MTAARLRSQLKELVNRSLRRLNVRIERANSGPRGMADTLRRLRRHGLIIHSVVDVGAARGEWTEMCREVFPDATYALFEPRRSTAGALDELCRRHPRVRVFHTALGARTGEQTFYSTGDQSSFLPSSFAGPQLTLPIARLDDLVERGDVSPPHLIKADVQGYELEVLAGAERCLDSCEVLFLEANYRRFYEHAPLAEDVICYVRDRGYRLFDICTYVQRPCDLELAYSDLCFAKASSALFAYEGYA
jgi:FkbM family methyltransferase